MIQRWFNIDDRNKCYHVFLLVKSPIFFTFNDSLKYSIQPAI